MTTEFPPRISLCFGQIQLYIPRSKADINRARKLLDLLEEEINESKAVIVPVEIKPCRCSQTTPQDERQGQPTQPSPEKPYGVPAPIQQVLSTPQIEASTPTQEREDIDRLISNCFKNSETYHELLDFMAKNGNPIEISKGCARDQGSLGTKTSKTPEIVPDANLASNFIPKFEWDRAKEKSYRTIFFFEHEDGSRVMIFYLNSRIFTTKEAVMTLPHPVPYNYAPLRAIQNNKRTALKFYREYLYKEAEAERLKQTLKDPLVQLALGGKVLTTIKDRGIFEDILLYEDENKDEDDTLSDSAKEAEEKRLEKLRKAAEVNAGRWKDMSPRTKELRKNIVLKASMGVGAD